FKFQKFAVWNIKRPGGIDVGILIALPATIPENVKFICVRIKSFNRVFISATSDLPVCAPHVNLIHELSTSLRSNDVAIKLEEFMDLSMTCISPFAKPEDGFHPTIYISLDVRFCKRNEGNKRAQEYNFIKTNYGSFTNLDTLSSLLYDTLKPIFLRCVKLDLIDTTSMCSPWWTKKCKRIPNYKYSLFKKCRRNGCPIVFAPYMVAKQGFLSFNNK
uniref:Uncharacterized protein n=1 Tax=Glossina palpalis gambiensis TaxID=67801 RepID=A0A1B0BWK6_9MUSC